MKLLSSRDGLNTMETLFSMEDDGQRFSTSTELEKAVRETAAELSEVGVSECMLCTGKCYLSSCPGSVGGGVCR